jgi:toxin CptA
MSSRACVPRLSIERRPSGSLAAFLIAVHAAAGGALAATPLPAWVHVTLLAATVASLVHGLATQALVRGTRACRELTWESSGEWTLRRGSEPLAARLLGTSFVHPRLVVLNFRLARGRASVVLPFDGVDAEVFRRLRVRLVLERLGADAGAEASQARRSGGR